MSDDDDQTRPRWRTRPTGLRWRRHGLAGGIAAGLLLAGGGAGYAAGSTLGEDERTPAVEQVEDGRPDGTPPHVPSGRPSSTCSTAGVLPQA
ncbi:hypothetical protein [Nocardioides sp. AX2bis]|uniref:hypothetical protein n=1 Tax=Nocardioides sp. AX2bis TaxID=2653157 RepID=UPI0012F13042|nr:hypothetical protein [Nocardioides sp. AX2bis]VXB89753.1 hypothetical protein NOCARDAX2BIS_380140 [Nocardioides sp. AX2bis]